MMKHFSKLLELVPLPYHNNEGSSYAFLDRMLSKFGVPTKVFINQGIEFQRDFQDLCEKALINSFVKCNLHFNENIKVK
jgi:hypothetical protein